MKRELLPEMGALCGLRNVRINWFVNSHWPEGECTAEKEGGGDFANEE